MTKHDCVSTTTMERVNGWRAGLVAALLVPTAWAQDAPRCLRPASGTVSWLPGGGVGSDSVTPRLVTLYGNAAFAGGVVGSAFSFPQVDLPEGNPVAGDHVLVGNADGVFDLVNDFTIEFWINPATLTAPSGPTTTTPFSPSGIQEIFHRRAGGGYSIGLLDGGRLIAIKDDVAMVHSVDPVVVANAWQHVAVGFSSRDGVSLHVNGQRVCDTALLGPFSRANPTLDLATHPVYYPAHALKRAVGIGGGGGQAPDVVSHYYRGLVDEIRVYDRVLTDAQIQAIASAGGPGCNAAIHAMWVWPRRFEPNEINDPAQRATLVERAAASGVDVLYVSVFQDADHKSSSGRFMYEDAAMADLILQAHAAGIEVWATYGDSEWVQSDLRCLEAPAPGSLRPFTPLQLMDDVIAYNRDHCDARFQGVILDVEPPLTVPEPALVESLTGLIELFDCAGNRLGAAGVPLAAAISPYLDTDVTFPAANGTEKPAYQHALDQDFDHVVVMGYWEEAGNASEGAISIVQDEIVYAGTLGKSFFIVSGVESSNCVEGSDTPCGDQNTFFEEQMESLLEEAEGIREAFETSVGFMGFAVHTYGDSYLSGLPGWPIYDFGFITEVNTAVGASTTVQPLDNSTGDAPATVTFATVTEAGATRLTTSTDGPPPPVGFRVAGTYYEIATTATFTGPVEVCIAYDDADFTGPEDELRLDHFEDTDDPPDGIRDAWMDRTTSHDLAGNVLCATTDSLSPFAIVEPTNQPPTVACTGGGVVQAGDVVFVGGEVADVDGNLVAYEWAEADVPFASGEVATSPGGAPAVIPEISLGTGYAAELGVGVHVLDLRVDDGLAGSATCEVTVEVVDTLAPTVTAVPMPAILWPPNQTIRDVVIDVMAFDASGGPVTLSATAASSEAVGATAPDFTQPVIDQGTGIVTLQLRAERSGAGAGRKYTITITAADASGNSSTAVVDVAVAHDQRGR